MDLYYRGETISVSGSKPLTGLKVCALGDSNTQYMGGNINDRVVALTGCASVANLGYAGATWGNANGNDTVTDATSAIGLSDSVKLGAFLHVFHLLNIRADLLRRLVKVAERLYGFFFEFGTCRL